MANCSPRYVQLDRLEAWTTGRQYDGMKSWWSDAVPLWDRAPCIVYPVVDIAASSFVDLILGEGRFPEFITHEAESDDDESGLSQDDSLKLDRFIRDHHRICRFRAHARDALYSGLTVSSAAVVHGVRGGKPFVDLIPAKWCEPELGQDHEVLKLVIQYPFQEQYKQQDGAWAVRTKLYRRVIDNKRDIEYFPADAREDGAEVASWRENPARSVDHALGFTPVIWYPLMRGCVPINVVDGKAIHRNVTDEIRQHDLARSQWHRGALFSEPQIFEIGVSPGHNPTGVGVTPLVASTERGGSASHPNNRPGSPDYNPKTYNPIVGGFADPAQRQNSARKKGPGHVWQYPNSETKVGALFYPGDALKAQEDNCRDLRMKLQESLAVIFLDPESIKFAATTSGKALEAIKQKQIDRCDQYRDDLSECFFEPSVSMQLRIAQVILSRGDKLNVPGANKVKAILDKFVLESTDVGAPTGWQMPTLQTRWGDYFKADADEQQKIVNMVIAALGAAVPILTVRLALQKLAPIFGIENIAAIEAELEKADAKRKADDIERTNAENSAMHDLAASMNADAGRAGKPSGTKPPKAPAKSSGGDPIPATEA